MRFAKYQGIGNDFVMLADPDDAIRLTPEIVRSLCDRRFGIGADGVIRVAPGADGADFFMDYVNSDGSIGEMCGNGIRCLAIFARAEGLTAVDEMQVDTRAGRKVVTVDPEGMVTVDMGPPIFEPARIPVDWAGSDALHAKFELDDDVVEGACVSMGNPHVVLFQDPSSAPVTTLGPILEKHPAFPNGTNVEFLRVDTADHVTMRVWERGSGETLACGTGAAAVAVIARVLGGADAEMTVSLPGGDLRIRWAGSLDVESSVFMTGPAVKSFDGDIDLPRRG
ncbi:MAG: diaminopimelate epimerase [Actinomycetota bacterium]